ncbi:MAG: hypothetical protein FJY11_06360 [Bacteroidetes bacterium]|nr:hypothetical protein [Bacteroidota bacterium]
MQKYFTKYSFIILLILMAFLAGACASSRKPNWIKERKKSGYVSTSRLGKNKYYFSSSYQKKLTRSVKNKR